MQILWSILAVIAVGVVIFGAGYYFAKWADWWIKQ